MVSIIYLETRLTMPLQRLSLRVEGSAPRLAQHHMGWFMLDLQVNGQVTLPLYR